MAVTGSPGMEFETQGCHEILGFWMQKVGGVGRELHPFPLRGL